MKKLKKCLIKVRKVYVNNVVFNSFLILILLLGVVSLPRIFAQLQPVKSIEIFSKKLNYEKQEPGSWKIEKSAKWISKNEAEITFDVDTLLKSNVEYTDVLFVLDVSSSMEGDKLNRVKIDTVELIESLFSNNKNRAGLITFESDSQIVSNFTNNKDELIEKVNSLVTEGCTNYYKALMNVDTILKNYVKEKERECIVLFLTDGYPNEEIPNEEVQYSYLKSQYPFITINGVQYEMGNAILEPIKKVSDNQFIADMKTLNNVLFDASVNPIIYEKFEITDYIDTDYFYVEDKLDISVNKGSFEFNNTNQKIVWKINNFKSGLNAKMTLKAKLRDEFIDDGGIYPTNSKATVKTKLGDVEEDIVSSQTPILKANYKVIYDANEPRGCKVENLPMDKDYSVYDTVGLSSTTPKCDGYQFKGWKLISDEVERINDDYFIMPEHDVVIRAKWSKLDISKSMEGKVKESLTLYKKIQQDVWDKTKYAKKYRGSTETFNGNDEVYYYYGDAKNNNVLFADYCWKIVRTTDTGGVKIIYNGVPSDDGKCDNTGSMTVLSAEDMGTTSSSIGFNASSKSLSDVGYMYNTRYENDYKKYNYEEKFIDSRYISTSSTVAYTYADSYTLDGTAFVFDNPEELIWRDNYKNLAGKYVCFRNLNDGKCTSPSYVVGTSESYMYYLNVSSSKEINDFKITFGESVIRNSDGTFTLQNPTVVKLKDWYTVRNDFSSSFTCGDDRLTCDLATIKSISYTSNTGFTYARGEDNCKYGNSFKWDGSKYILESTVDIWNFYKEKSTIENNHYTCWNDSGECSEISYIYGTNYEYAVSIKLTGGKSIDDAIHEMLFADDVNTKDSTLKAALDYWYSNNMTEYTNFLEDTVWCNNRNVVDLGGWNYDGGKTDYSLEFESNDTKSSSLTCKYVSDRFTVDTENGNGKLTYPVGFITKQESYLSTDPYSHVSPLGSGNYFWSGTPHSAGYTLYMTSITGSGLYNHVAGPANAYSVRPVISLHPGIEYESGDGSSDAPYIIDMSIDNLRHSVNIEKGKNYYASTESAYSNQTVHLLATQEHYVVKSFKLNGKLISGSSFTMGNRDANITDVEIEFYPVLESEHNPYSPGLNEVKEKKFKGATSLTIDLEYETINLPYDYIYVYDGEGTKYGPYSGFLVGGGCSHITFTIPGDYVKIEFSTYNSSSNNKYGYKATITPHYD